VIRALIDCGSADSKCGLPGIFLPEARLLSGVEMKTKREQAVVLQVELTQYGWTLTEDDTSQGLFISKDKALVRLKERQKALKAGGRASNVVVTAQEDPPRAAKWRVRSMA
jgi:hypothetical protein